MFDPNTLETLATFQLPPRQHLPSNLFQDFTGGGYFYLDNQDRVVAATTTHHIYVIAETAGSPGLHARSTTIPLTSVLSASEDITSALPDSNGLLWFVTKTDGVVGTVNLSTGARSTTIHLGNGADGRDRELVRHRSGRRGLHRHQPQALPLRRRPERYAPDRLAGHLSEQRRAQAGPGRRRHRDHAHRDAGRLREHHRQRRPDGHHGLPDRRPPEHGDHAAWAP